MNNTLLNKRLPCVFLLTTSLACFADSPYVGVDYLVADIDVANENVKPKMAIFRAGVSNNNIAFEAQFLHSHATAHTHRVTFDIEQSKALYLVLQSDTVEGFRFDVSLGYAANDLTVTGPENTYNGTSKYSGFSWGLSLVQQLPYFSKTQVRLGYQSLYKDSYIEVTGMSLGLTYQF